MWPSLSFKKPGNISKLLVGRFEVYIFTKMWVFRTAPETLSNFISGCSDWFIQLWLSVRIRVTSYGNEQRG